MVIVLSKFLFFAMSLPLFDYIGLVSKPTVLKLYTSNFKLNLKNEKCFLCFVYVRYCFKSIQNVRVSLFMWLFYSGYLRIVWKKINGICIISISRSPPVLLNLVNLSLSFKKCLSFSFFLHQVQATSIFLLKNYIFFYQKKVSHHNKRIKKNFLRLH